MQLTEELIKSWVKEASDRKAYPSPLFPPSLYYRFFRVMAEHLKPNLTVVLGVCGGGDCLHFALGNPQGQVVGVDLEYDHPEQLQHVKYTCSNFSFWHGDSLKSAASIFSHYGTVDILFIDTTHTKEQTWAELNAWGPYMSDNYIICFDDLKRKEMGNIWDELPEPKLRLDELHPIAEGGFGIIWK